MGKCHWTGYGFQALGLDSTRHPTHVLKWLFFTAGKKKNSRNFLFEFLKKPKISQILLQLWLIGNRTSHHPIWSVVILVIKQIRPLLRDPILLITYMITDWIRLHSVLLLLLWILLRGSSYRIYIKVLCGVLFAEMGTSGWRGSLGTRTGRRYACGK